jgi:4-hydroxy-3-methylbut-2-en-1-yl diphosphate reductase
MKRFNIPSLYKSPIVSKIKEMRKAEDPLKKNYAPTILDFGPVKFFVARHFGFCYGVENAIEIAYKTIDENPGKKIYLLSEMIHNPLVNYDLQSRGIKIITDNYGNQMVDWSEITPNDIVLIPAFGTSVETENFLRKKGIDTTKFNTTCPFVEKVWIRAAKLGKEKFTVVIHGKAKHEETRATFSHSIVNSPSVIIRDIEEAKLLAEIIIGKVKEEEFYRIFGGKFSQTFNPAKDLVRIGVVNQTTMLATETQAISDLLREAMIKKYGKENIKEHFADTHDTLCYATNDNQQATKSLLKTDADIAIVIGGYNSSNTSHLVEILEEKFVTYFISDVDKIISSQLINHFNLKMRKEIISENYFPQKEKINIAVTSGASCPDAAVDDVLNKILSFFDLTEDIDSVLKKTFL